MNSRRSPYVIIAVSIIVNYAIYNRAEIYDPKCPGVCSPVAVPDCKTLCANLGFPGSYCKGLTCCCKPKSSKPPLS
ncbi:hypothetical protein F2Q70_00032125 [Brassica cretica]|uniref:Knottin scorpion toxin-like domain-containing protein n=1 Tax=Brassica cretica TaxID=69181 RepID=A0A8S9FJX6_BRACR|nr:hypothetical protein F2Q70_00032125 [Brassica cretica]